MKDVKCPYCGARWFYECQTWTYLEPFILNSEGQKIFENENSELSELKSIDGYGCWNCRKKLPKDFFE